MFSKKHNENVKKILIIAHANIGDIANDVVFIHPLRQKFPEAQIHFLTSPRAKPIVEGYKGIDQVIIMDRHHAHKGILGRFRFNQSLNKEHYDLVIVLVKTFMHQFLRAKKVWDVRKEYRHDFAPKEKHPLDIYRSFMRDKGIEPKEFVFEYGLEREKTFCEELLKSHGISPGEKIAGILPISTWTLKCWPIEKWNELAAILKKDYGMKTIALGTVSCDYDKEVLKEMSPEIISLVDKTTLKQAMALISYCEFFIGPDSSLLHIASNMGVESIGLYGPTPLNYVYPYFHHHNLVTPKEVPAGMSCYKNPHHCQCRHGVHPGACMQAIATEDVLKVIQARRQRLVQ